MTKVWVSGEPDLNNEAFVYLVSKNPMAIGTDTWGVDVVPPAKGDKVFYGHVTTLVQNGVYKCADPGSIPVLSRPFRSICVVRSRLSNLRGDRSIKKPDQSSNPTGAPAENSEKDYLGQVSCIR